MLFPIRLVSLALVAVLVTAGCTQERELPARADAATMRSLDVCALVPLETIKQKQPGLAFEYGSRLSLEPDSCWFALVGAGPVAWLEPIDSAPKEVTELEVEGVTEERVPGGLLIVGEPQGAQGCRHYAVSDNGVWLQVNVEILSKDDERVCALAKDLALVALANLANGIPSVDWPANSLYGKDICAVARDVGIGKELGFSEDLVADPSSRECTYDSDGPFLDASVRAAVGGTLTDVSEPTDIEIAGRPAQVASGPSKCEVIVDFGANEALPDGTHEGLHLEAIPGDGGTCDQVVTAMEALVPALA